MPYRSERKAILKSINRQLFFTGTWMSLLDTEDPLRPEYEQRVIELIEWVFFQRDISMLLYLSLSLKNFEN